MKLNQKNTSKKKKLIIAGSILLIIIVGAIGAAAYYKVGPFKTSDDSVNLKPPTTDQKKAGDSAKQNTVNPTGNKESGSTGSDPLPPPIQNGSSKPTVGADITAANQNSDVLQVRMLIQAVTSAGTCTLSMTGPGNRTYLATASVQAQPSSTTCKGFDIPISSLAPGSWAITINFSNDDYTATASKQVSIH